MTEQGACKYRADEKVKRIAQRKALLKAKEAKNKKNYSCSKRVQKRNYSEYYTKTFSVPYKPKLSMTK